ncbi:MAG: HYR domain-containing protein [Verrucomicrobiia bacterium]
MKKRLFLCTVVLSLAALIGVARAVLLGVTVIPPIITYVSPTTTATTYNPVTEVFSVVAPDVTVQFSTNGPTLTVTPPRSLTINILVDNNGNLIGSAGPGPDLVISGKVTQVVAGTNYVYSGLLLSGKIYAFGSGYFGSGVGDFDFRFTPTGGQLESLYTCDHIGVTLDSEDSTFTGSFSTNFQGEAKGTVGLEDLIPPTVTCPTNIILQCNASSGGLGGAYYTYPQPVGSDPCSTNLTFVYMPPSGSFFALPYNDESTNYTVTLTATDPAGNSNSCEFTVTVEDTVPPVLDVADPIIGQCEIAPFVLTNAPGTCAAPFTFEIPTAFDQCCTNNLIVTVSAVDQTNAVILLTNNGDGTMSGNFPVTCPNGTNVITSVAVDDHNNSSSATCEVLVVDEMIPEIQNCSNQVVECTANTPNGGAVNFIEPTAFDWCPNLTTSSFPTNGSVLPLGTNLIVYTASDFCSGQSNSCTFEVIVQDTTPPAITCPPNVTVTCAQSTNVSNTGSATATDTCDPSPKVTYTDAAGPVSCTGLPGVNRTWTATDASGNSASCVQSITYTNTTAPTVTVPTGSNLGCNPATLPTCASVKAQVTASDTCGTPTINVTSATTGTACAETLTFTVTATDGCGNTSAPQYVVYTYTVDTTPPVLSVPTGGSLGCNPTLPTITSVKALSSAIATCGSATINVTSATTGSPCAETLTFTVTATDACNNTSTAYVVYTYTVDTTAPSITCPTNITVVTSDFCTNTVPASNASIVAFLHGVTATDNCGSGATVTNNAPSTFSLGTNTVTFTATDSCGNSATCTASVIVVSQPVTCHPVTCAPSFCDHHFDNFGNCQYALFEGNITLSDGDQPCDFRTSSNSYYSVKVTVGTNVVYCKSQILCNVDSDGCGGEAWEYYGNNNYERSICRFTDNQAYNACMDPNLPSSSATKNKNCGELSTVSISADQTRFYYGFQQATQPICVVVDGLCILSYPTTWPPRRSRTRSPARRSTARSLTDWFRATPSNGTRAAARARCHRTA